MNRGSIWTGLSWFALAMTGQGQAPALSYSADGQNWSSDLVDGATQNFEVSAPESAWVFPIMHVTILSGSLGGNFPELHAASNTWTYTVPWSGTTKALAGPSAVYGPLLDSALGTEQEWNNGQQDTDAVRRYFIPITEEAPPSDGVATKRVRFNMGNWAAFHADRVSAWRQLIHADDNLNNDPDQTPDRFSIWHLVMKAVCAQLGPAKEREFLNGHDASGRPWLDAACDEGELKLHLQWIAVQGEDPPTASEEDEVPGLVGLPTWLGETTSTLRVYSDFDLGPSGDGSLFLISGAPHGRLSPTMPSASPGAWAHVLVSRPLVTTAVALRYKSGGLVATYMVVGKRKNDEVTGFKFLIPSDADPNQIAQIQFVVNESGSSDGPVLGDTWADIHIQ